MAEWSEEQRQLATEAVIRIIFDAFGWRQARLKAVHLFPAPPGMSEGYRGVAVECEPDLSQAESKQLLDALQVASDAVGGGKVIAHPTVTTGGKA